MIAIGLRAARNTLPALVRAIAATPITLTYRGRPVAEIVAVGTVERLAALTSAPVASDLAGLAAREAAGWRVYAHGQTRPRPTGDEHVPIERMANNAAADAPDEVTNG